MQVIPSSPEKRKATRLVHPEISQSVFHLFSHRIPALSGLPAMFSTIRADMGLMDPEWNKLGKPWQMLATSWLAAELRLTKSGKPPLEYKMIATTGLPDAVQMWAANQLSRSHVLYVHPTAQTAEEMKKWVSALSLSDGEAALKQAWCTSGKVGINLLLLGMKFWADVCGIDADWEEAMEKLVSVFQSITVAPSL